MDTSEQNILMCKKAEEIQAQWKYSGIYNGKNILIQGIVYFNGDVLYQRGLECVWLPRQDQLQEMVGIVTPFYYQLEDLTYFYRDYAQDSRSYEQLWLAFVMKEKHNKVWDGKDWIRGQ